MPELFFKHEFSAVGKTTSGTLNALRKQLGVGCDPAFDYAEIAEMQRKLAKGENQKSTRQPTAEEAGAGGATSLEQLRRALRDVVGSGAATNELPHDEADGAEGGGTSGSPLSPADVRELREKQRPTRSFMTPTRDKLRQLDIDSRFRAPPVGTYKPKEDLLHLRPRAVGRDFGIKDPTRSRKELEKEEEIAKLKAEKQSTDHLEKVGTSLELKPGIPEMPRHSPSCDFGKGRSRPDIVKTAGITYHTNSFTTCVLDGDLKCSVERSPEWDFAKTSTAPAKQREYYFQPGQYKPNFEAVRPRLAANNIPFEKRPKRQPFDKGLARVGDHLPDRSLSRSCPVLSKFRDVKAPLMDHYTARPTMKKIDYHRADDPAVDQAVLEHEYTFDAMQARNFMDPKMLTVQPYNESISRLQQMQIQRAYGDDIPLQRSKSNVSEGPRSVELVEGDVGNKPSLQPRVKVRNFGQISGREKECKYTKAPARKINDRLSKATQFKREERDGDSRLEPGTVSDLAMGMTRFRDERFYDASDGSLAAIEA
eukprot:TRINITY_DN74879_c0_g1_i1.p1 TRINITY_DN74879_c0_g1~~TRINITY_DN74879_c0_g1_i1.p1  ORF type:complete len:558 (-),score=123.42 TRINITY_DN74879_c0_g1_i1:98-1708(-)